MAEMTPLFALFALIPVFLSALVVYTHQRTHGTLDITTASVAYDRQQYGDLLDWDKYALEVEGKPTMIFSAEFHYWRVPDRERWPTILKQYKIMGMNAIRIYFHWGYHSSAEGVYNFEGNRDIDYLLNICEELGLFVLAAPGPYICAEVQAGGYPSWLIAKRHLRIRHNEFMLWRTYDEEFAGYEIQWLNHVLPIIAKHQITLNGKSNKKGCVLALQLDNELFETMAVILPIGLRDQMRVLAKAARDAGITVPLFSNDGFEESSWVPRPATTKKKEKSFGLDLYGFDKYVVFAPTSAPTSWFLDTGNSTASWKDWNPKQMEKSIDRLEKTVRAFGGGAKESPMFIPELQGGWFNHYQLEHTYDMIYEFYGDQYTKLLVDSCLAQGISIVSLYMTYGGTNWGTIGDPDVYTSYDYSGCIREYGYLSMRGRNLRQTILFARSFDPYFTKTEKLQKRSIKSSAKKTINTQRVSVNQDQPVLFTFLRNYNRDRQELFDLTVQNPEGNFTMPCYLPYKTSFTAVGDYRAANGLHLLQATIPIHLRMANPETNEEVWIVEPNQFGGLAFEHREMEISGNMQEDVLRRHGPADVLKFEKNEGWSKLSTTTGNLYLVGLTKAQVSTLYADFESVYWNEGNGRMPGLIAWGADEMYYNTNTRQLEINYRRSDSSIHIVSFEKPADSRFAAVSRGVYNMPHMYTMEFQHAHQKLPLPVQIALRDWEVRPVNFQSLPWQPLKRLTNTSEPTFEALDYHYTSGHVLYRTTFETPDSGRQVKLSLNMRNRATVMLNGQIIGGHTTYSRQLFSPGAKIGPDPWFMGSQTYDLTPYLLRDDTESALNELVVLVDSFGLARQAFIMNDVRNPRGIIKAKLQGLSQKHPAEWQITGVDVRTLDNQYNSCGFPDERTEGRWELLGSRVEQDRTLYRMSLNTGQGVQWVRFRFDALTKSRSSDFSVPLRLHMDGPFTAYVFLNDAIIARYYGNGDSPQHDFYVPDGLVRQRNAVRMLMYSWEDTTGEISINGWPIKMDSGNLISSSETDAVSVTGSTTEVLNEYLTWKENVRV
ncbi:glycoside hydrolase superfamily [Zychaea mexicana]|uniref:glycoside hydrolase superfamily n=1 Tax=Zychaea mexicana TaxID=64656 RepID=UPI0022FE15B2|nr:glycoside hydrolase superfamily [Zychaea mexicana]KAI9491061.1 glycoside hydrolase superfamily [Zychaea mexicana]